MIKIALAQREASDDVDFNIRMALEDIAEAADSGSGLVCFPEIQFSPFFPQYPNSNVSKYVMTLDGYPLKMMRESAAHHKVVVCPNLYLHADNHHYDASPVIDANGELLGVSKMVNIMQSHQFYEQDYYTPSDTGYKVYETAIGLVGVVICFDRHRPESITRCVEQGADLIIIPTANTVAEPMDIFEWELRVEAYRNGVFIAMCNRVGLEDKMNFAGESLVVGPKGEVIAKGSNESEIVYAEIDMSRAGLVRSQKPLIKNH